MNDEDKKEDRRGDEIGNYLSGESTPEESGELEKRILADAELSERLYSEINLLSALDGTASNKSPGVIPISKGEKAKQKSRWKSILLPLAAGLLVGVFSPKLKQMIVGDDPAVYRGESTGATAISPIGDLAEAPDRFVWHSAKGAASYRFTLLDREIRVAYEAVTRDTSLAIPNSSVQWAGGTEWIWRIVPLDAMSAEMPAGPPTTIRISE